MRIHGEHPWHWYQPVTKADENGGHGVNVCFQFISVRGCTKISMLSTLCITGKRVKRLYILTKISAKTNTRTSAI